MKDFEKIIWGDSLTLIDFFATWCRPCEAMHNDIEQLKVNMNGRVDVYKIDVDSAEDAPIIQRYKIQSIPTLIFFRNGEILWRGSGRMTYNQLRDVVEMIEQKAPTI